MFIAWKCCSGEWCDPLASCLCMYDEVWEQVLLFYQNISSTCILATMTDKQKKILPKINEIKWSKHWLHFLCDLFFYIKKNIYLTEQLRKNYDSAESDRKLLITEMQRLRTQYEDLIKQLEQTQVIVDQQKVSSKPTQFCIYLHRATLFKVLPPY